MSPGPGGDADIRSYDDADPAFSDDDGVVRCGVPKTTDGEPCNHPVPNGDCPTHGDREARIDAVTDGDVQLPDGVGSGDPGHSLGTEGAAPEGNKNAMTHGVYASKNDPWGTLEYLQENEPRVYAQVVRWFWDEAKTAPFDVYSYGDAADVPDDPDGDGIPGIDVGRLTADAADLLVVSLDRGITYRATLSQATDGLATEQVKATNDGPVQTIDENPVNLPKNRMRREDRAQLKDLGLRDDSPDAVAAQGQQDLASAAERVAKRQQQGGESDGD